MKSYNTGVYDSYTEETFDRYNIKAKNIKAAILKTKIKFGIKYFKENKNLKIDVDKDNYWGDIF